MTIDLARVREAINCAVSDRPPTAVEVRDLWRCLHAYIEEVLPLTKMRLLDRGPSSEARREAALAVQRAEDLLTLPVALAVGSSSYPRQLARVLAGLIRHSGVEQ
ncbi:DUF6415 family natural product biosynthesis protein [Streptomyces sp. NPDC057654]|uniref:DUF6415 family natural product biosynthesis protein n=1 Tax=Streptomyces sp. NPDC057654 TaxID=3346196 RepID=UPI0036A55C7D